MPSLPDKPGVLYIFYDAHGEPIYIGATCDWASRLSAHKRRSPWFGEVETWDLFPFDTLAEAREREARAIAAARPAYNVQHKNQPAVKPQWHGRGAA